MRTPPSRSAFPTRFNYYSTPRSTLETQVHSIPATDIGRFVRLKDAFANAGCSGDAMKVQAVTEKRGSSSFNLICTWPADSPDVTVVVAHYRGAGSGQGAVENWSGALLLPYLYFAMEAQPRENTWVFVESSGKAGTAAYFRSLSRKQQRQIRAMVSLDGLGVGNVVRFYTPFPDTPYLPPDSVHLQMVLLLASLSDDRVPRPEPTNPMTWLTDDDTQPFRYREIPSIVLHSVPVEEAALPGSVNDTAAAVDGNAYFQNYRAIAIFLVDLDSLAASLDRESDIWNSVDAQPGSR
ncbi:MAG TPA: M28 family peptidase [Acidobacteriaceae bacterium]|nr:M28 family peptidase [Acidobacteriaceae bacterium]